MARQNFFLFFFWPAPKKVCPSLLYRMTDFFQNSLKFIINYFTAPLLVITHFRLLEAAFHREDPGPIVRVVCVVSDWSRLLSE